jgi:very-long-chain (3R)-3-hydroxyacyl-CoA dehydratase
MGLGNWVKVTQTLAVLDVVHAALGLVKSNVGTAASQVFSRLWAVWAVVEMVPEVRPLLLFLHVTGAMG